MNKMNKCYTSKTTRNKITVLLRVETLKIFYWGNEPQSTVRFDRSRSWPQWPCVLFPWPQWNLIRLRHVKDDPI